MTVRYGIFEFKFQTTAIIQLQVHATGSQGAQNTHPAAAAGGATAGGGGRWRLGGPRPAAASGRGALRLGHQPAYNACGSPNSPTHPSPFCFYNFKTPNGVTFPNTTPVQKQGSRTGRQPSRSPRLPTGMGSRTGSMLPITHACAETGFPYGKATFP